MRLIRVPLTCCGSPQPVPRRAHRVPGRAGRAAGPEQQDAAERHRAGGGVQKTVLQHLNTLERSFGIMFRLQFYFAFTVVLCVYSNQFSSIENHHPPL